jgi:hypothetical protein
MLFYIPAIDGKWIDNSIAGWTRIWNLDCPKELICSHQEIWTPDEDGNFTFKDEYSLYPIGKCWTSTMGQIRDKKAKYNGVCVRPASEVLTHSERWFYTELETHDEDYRKMIVFMQDEVKNNKGYDVSMILNFFIPVGIGRKDKYICSEFSNVSANIGLDCNLLSDKFSPIRTVKTLNKLGVKFYNLYGCEIQLLKYAKKRT